MATPIALMLMAFLFSCIAVAQDTPPQPRKASVVMPLLKELSPKDSPQSIDQQITRILGDKYFEMGDGALGSSDYRTTRYYILDDRTTIIAYFTGDNLRAVAFLAPGKSPKDLKWLYKANAGSN
ncbi:MAG TPA: hypothetical protein VG733_12290 [Chthoniobacteraceae bacterium]|nr:hypothetical protein [Chthoniobacteraceae bacterium]